MRTFLSWEMMVQMQEASAHTSQTPEERPLHASQTTVVVFKCKTSIIICGMSGSRAILLVIHIYLTEYMFAGNPFAGSSGSAFSTGPQAVQTAGVTQNPFASKSGTNSGLTIGVLM